MRSKSNSVDWFYRAKDSLHLLVVAVVSSLDVVPDRISGSMVVGPLSLLDHVSSTDDLHSNVITDLLGSLQFQRYDARSALQVALEGVH